MAGLEATTPVSSFAVANHVAKADACRAKGNEALNRGDFADACASYDEGLLALVRASAAPADEIREVRLKLHLNAALAHFRRGNLGSSIDHADGALAIDPGNAKALYRRAFARVRLAECLGQQDKARLALADFDRVLELDPQNVEALEESKKLRGNAQAKERDAKAAQKNMFKGVFSSKRALYEEPLPTAPADPVFHARDSDGSRTLLEARSVSFAYEPGTQILRDVSVELKAGRCIGIFGNNAAGKSTLARLLTRQRHPQQGEVVLAGEHGTKAPLIPSMRLTMPLSVAGGVAAAVAAANMLSPAVAAALGVILSFFIVAAVTASRAFWTWYQGPTFSPGAVAYLTSEDAPGQKLPEKATIERVIGDRLPKCLPESERRAKVIALLEAAGFQMYDQKTSEPVGRPADYVRNSLPVGHLSGGQKHLIYILTMVAGGPKVLVCDESLGGLDSIRQPRVLHMLRRMKLEQGCALLYISCELHQLRIVADDIGFVSHGRISELGPALTVLDSPKHPDTKEYINLYRSLPGGHVIGGSLAKAYEEIKQDEALAGPWLPPPGSVA